MTMIFKYWLGCCLTALLLVPIFAQAQPEEEVVPIHFSDTTWYDKGFDFYIGAGMFIGNKFNANYYNGSNLNENSLNYLFSNKYLKDDLLLEIYDAYPGVSGDVNLPLDPGGDYNWNTNYKLNIMISLGLRYKIRNGWGISLSYSYSQLTTNAQCMLLTQNPTGTSYVQPVMSMVGKERRSMFDLSFSYLFSKVHRVVKPFIELGVQFNYAKVKSFEACLLGADGRPTQNTHTLLDYYNGEGYYPGAQAYDFITFGGPGFGFSGSAGLKIALNQFVSLDPSFYCSASRVGIYQQKNSPVEGFKEDNRFAFNYGVLLRVTVNDFFIAQHR